MRINLKNKSEPVFTHGGAKASHITPELQLRRSVMSCLLWEDEHYEEGQTIADRIQDLVAKVKPEIVSQIAIEARQVHGIRHAPLLLAVQMAKVYGGPIVGDTVAGIVQRADELTELLALYWKDGRKPVDAQFKRGLRQAFGRFDEYQLAKYNRDNTVKLRDVMRLVHPKPSTEAQAALWKRLIKGELATPDTWEVELSKSGKAGKKDVFTNLLLTEKLGYMAVLRNLRGMIEADVPLPLIRSAILARRGSRWVLPFRYVAAARAAPSLEPEIDQAMQAAINEQQKLPGRTVIVVDISGSMGAPLSKKSDMNRMDAACALAAVARGAFKNVGVYATAGNDGSRIHATGAVPPRHGMALIDAIKQQNRTLGGGGIFLKQVMDWLAPREKKAERLIVVTDEQDCDYSHAGRPENAVPIAEKAYMINVGSAKNGIGYGKFCHIDGFSEAVLKYIVAVESAGVNVQSQ